MAAFLISFIVVILIESGGRTQWLAAELAQRDAPRSHLAALLAAALLACLIASQLGGALHAMLPPRAGQLFQALALLFAGGAMLVPAKPFVPAQRLALPLLFGAALLIQLVDASQFVILATAAREGQPLLAATGGMFALAAALLIGWGVKADGLRPLPLRGMRAVAGAGLIGAGLWQALGALRLIGAG